MSTLNVSDINLSGKIDEFKGADIASAASIDLGAATGNLVHVTGTTTITSLGTAPQAGLRRVVIFDGVLTLTHNASTLVLPGAENLVTAAGDKAVFIADSTTKWVLASYTRLAVGVNAGQFLAKQVLVSGTTYTPTAGTKKAKVRGWAAGGAGGSTSAVAGAAAGGGGSGGYFEYWVENVSGTYTYAIGVGGAPVAGGSGNAGGNTIFIDGATSVTANGGGGGNGSAGTAAIKTASPGLGGNVSVNGSVNGAGNPGTMGMTSTVVTVGAAGNGGATSLGGAGRGTTYLSAGPFAGQDAVANTGSGGSGAATGTTTAALGGNGADGIIIIEEYR